MGTASGCCSTVIIGALLLCPCLSRADAPLNGQVAAELTRQGREHAREGDDTFAVRRFAEALELDPTYGPAYLELGAARERAGDLEEADKIYSIAIDRLPGFAEGYRARAALKRRMGDGESEMQDLESAAAISQTNDSLRELADRYVELRAWPAALSTWRRIAIASQGSGDESASREAITKIRALSLLCRELDPVSSGASGRGWVRRAEASVARRRGF